MSSETLTEARVRLTWPEVSNAAHVGCMRNIQCLQENWQPGAACGYDNLWTTNIEGAAGEMALAKHLGIFWSGAVGDIKADDAGPYQVRTNTSRKLDDMILRPRDREDRVYISVLSFLPDFILCGWIYGDDGKNERWLRDGSYGRPPCFFVPRKELQPLDTLPRLP